MDEIWEALESTTDRSRKALTNPKSQPTKNDYRLRIKDIVYFLEELDGSLSVSEVREALDEYE